MMVTGLPLQPSPLDGLLSKSQPRDAETSQSVSFGEVLKTKEKELQLAQEVNAHSDAAAALQYALAARQIFLPDVNAGSLIDEVGSGNDPSSATSQPVPVPASDLLASTAGSDPEKIVVRPTVSTLTTGDVAVEAASAEVVDVSATHVGLTEASQTANGSTANTVINAVTSSLAEDDAIKVTSPRVGPVTLPDQTMETKTAGPRSEIVIPVGTSHKKNVSLPERIEAPTNKIARRMEELQSSAGTPIPPVTQVYINIPNKTEPGVQEERKKVETGAIKPPLAFAGEPLNAADETDPSSIVSDHAIAKSTARPAAHIQTDLTKASFEETIVEVSKAAPQASSPAPDSKTESPAPRVYAATLNPATYMVQEIEPQTCPSQMSDSQPAEADIQVESPQSTTQINAEIEHSVFKDAVRTDAAPATSNPSVFALPRAKYQTAISQGEIAFEAENATAQISEQLEVIAPAITSEVRQPWAGVDDSGTVVEAEVKVQVSVPTTRFRSKAEVDEKVSVSASGVSTVSSLRRATPSGALENIDDEKTPAPPTALPEAQAAISAKVEAETPFSSIKTDQKKIVAKVAVPVPHTPVGDVADGIDEPKIPAPSERQVETQSSARPQPLAESIPVETGQGSIPLEVRTTQVYVDPADIVDGLKQEITTQIVVDKNSFSAETVALAADYVKIDNVVEEHLQLAQGTNAKSLPPARMSEPLAVQIGTSEEKNIDGSAWDGKQLVHETLAKTEEHQPDTMSFQDARLETDQKNVKTQTDSVPMDSEAPQASPAQTTEPRVDLMVTQTLPVDKSGEDNGLAAKTSQPGTRFKEMDVNVSIPTDVSHSETAVVEKTFTSKPVVSMETHLPDAESVEISVPDPVSRAATEEEKSFLDATKSPAPRIKETGSSLDTKPGIKTPKMPKESTDQVETRGFISPQPVAKSVTEQERDILATIADKTPIRSMGRTWQSVTREAGAEVNLPDTVSVPGGQPFPSQPLTSIVSAADDVIPATQTEEVVEQDVDLPFAQTIKPEQTRPDFFNEKSCEENIPVANNLQQVYGEASIAGGVPVEESPLSSMESSLETGKAFTQPVASKVISPDSAQTSSENPATVSKTDRDKTQFATEKPEELSREAMPAIESWHSTTREVGTPVTSMRLNKYAKPAVKTSSDMIAPVIKIDHEEKQVTNSVKVPSEASTLLSAQLATNVPPDVDEKTSFPTGKFLERSQPTTVRPPVIDTGIETGKDIRRTSTPVEMPHTTSTDILKDQNEVRQDRAAFGTTSDIQAGTFESGVEIPQPIVTPDETPVGSIAPTGAQIQTNEENPPAFAAAQIEEPVTSSTRAEVEDAMSRTQTPRTVTGTEPALFEDLKDVLGTQAGFEIGSRTVAQAQIIIPSEAGVVEDRLVASKPIATVAQVTVEVFAPAVDHHVQEPKIPASQERKATSSAEAAQSTTATAMNDTVTESKAGNVVPQLGAWTETSQTTQVPSVVNAEVQIVPDPETAAADVVHPASDTLPELVGPKAAADKKSTVQVDLTAKPTTTPQSIADTPTWTEMDADSEINRPVPVQPEVRRVTLPQSANHLSQVQSTANQEKIPSRLKAPEPPVDPSTLLPEVQLSDSHVPASAMAPDHIAENAPEDVITYTTVQENVSEPSVARSGAKQERFVGSQNVERQTEATPVSSHTAVSRAEKIESVTQVKPDLKADSRNVVPARNADNVQTISTNTQEAGLDGAAMLAQVMSKKVTPASSKVHMPEARQDVPDAETSFSIEREPASTRMPELERVAAHPVTETAEVGTVGKETIVPDKAQAVEVVRQITQKLNVIRPKGATSIHLQLNPRELGEIDIQMVADAQGVSVTFFAEQTSTSRLLESQVSQLRQSLIDSGVQLSGLNISQHGPSGQKGESSNQNTNSNQYSQRSVPQHEANVKEMLHTERRTGQSSEVDYLI